MNEYINKLRGPIPDMYTDEFEDWEYYDPTVHGFDRDGLHENFWKDGGIEGEAISKDYIEWVNVEKDIKKRWNCVLEDTKNVINYGNDQINILLKGNMITKIGRKIMLNNKLNKVGLEIRNDSVLCNN